MDHADSKSTHHRWVWAFAIGLVFMCVAVLTVWLSLNRIAPTGERGLSAWNVPPLRGDGYDYDNIALCLARGRGFSKWMSDPEFKRPYERALTKDDERYANLFNTVIQGEGELYPATDRAPGYPVVLAGLYSVLGRNFAVARMFNCLLVGFAAAMTYLATCYITRHHVSGLLACGFLALNTQMWAYAKNILSEPFALALVALALYVAVRAWSSGRAAMLILAGLSVAAAVLTRSVLAPSIVFFALALLLVRRAPFRRRFQQAIIFLIACTLPIAAWSARTTLHAGRLTLLSTRADTDLPAGYTKTCLAWSGAWRPWTEQPYRDEVRSIANSDDEREIARAHRKVFPHILRQNAHLIPRLVAVKAQTTLPLPGINNHKLIHEITDAVVFYLAVIGAVFVASRSLGLIGFAPMLGTFVTSVIVHANPRFRLPTLPGLALLAALSLGWFVFRVSVDDLQSDVLRRQNQARDNPGQS